MGKIIIKHSGNEGHIKNERKTSIRRLLQGLIDFLSKENDNVWKNAEIDIYDNDYNAFRIISGNGDNKFIVQFKGHTENIEIVNIERQQSCAVL